MDGDKKQQDVYILLTSTKTFIGNTIKYVTQQPYNHVSIAFDKSLNKLYSFNIDVNGLRPEKIIEYPKETTYSLYKLTVDTTIVKRMKRFIHELENKGEEIQYNFVGLWNYIRDIPSEVSDKFTCSQFVSTLLTKAGITFKKDISLISPYDVVKNKELVFIRRGKLHNYKAD